MANRYQSDERSPRYRPQRGYGRQAEQFQSDYDDERRDQMGESWRDDDYGAQQSGWQADDRFDRDRDRGYRPSRSDRLGQERFDRGGYGSSRYSPGGERSYSSFTGGDFGGADFSRGPGAYTQERWPSGERGYGRSPFEESGRSGSYGAGSWLGANHGEWRERNYASDRDYRRHERDDRGFFERAGDAVARWFGDDEDGRWREGHRGRGPAGYTRTDDRIREDASERLTDDWAVDARKIELTVSNGEITLDGTVSSRAQKRRAEDLVEDVSGVSHVQNNLRVDQGSSWDRNNSGETTRSGADKATTSR